MRRAAGMGTLVDMGAVESMRATEGCEVRHVDAVFAEMVIGAARPVDRVDTERGDEGLGGRKALALGQDRPGLGRVDADLIGVEKAERPGEEQIGRASCRERVCQYG